MALTYNGEANADTFLRNDQPGTNHGVNQQNFAGLNGGGTEWTRTLINWAVPGDLAGETVISATVTVNLRDDYDNPATVGNILYAEGISQAWLEGTGWGADDAAAAGASWETYDGVNPWPGDQGGGDGVVYDSATVIATGQLLTFDIAALAQKWADGTLGTHGVKIAASSGTTTNGLSSREYTEGGAILDMTYTPEPATMMLLGLGGLLIRRKKA
jgi:hypothetical protein